MSAKGPKKRGQPEVKLAAIRSAHQATSSSSSLDYDEEVGITVISGSNRAPKITLG